MHCLPCGILRTNPSCFRFNRKPWSATTPPRPVYSRLLTSAFFTIGPLRVHSDSPGSVQPGFVGHVEGLVSSDRFRSLCLLGSHGPNWHCQQAGLPAGPCPPLLDCPFASGPRLLPEPRRRGRWGPVGGRLRGGGLPIARLLDHRRPDVLSLAAWRSWSIFGSSVGFVK